MPQEVRRLVAEGRMSCVFDADNCGILVTKDSGCNRLYYIVNDITRRLDLPDETVTELLFRTPQGPPETDVRYLGDMGFRENLIRDQYSAKVPDGCIEVVEYSSDLAEAERIATLFNDSFDRYSGDYVSEREAHNLHQSHSLLVVRNNSVLKGAMHITLQGTALWISHIAVYPEYRGQGVADRLMKMYFSEARRLGAIRLMLWVQRRNTAAVQMYCKYGFLPVNKSTVSFIKY